MKESAEKFEFEEAAKTRDEIRKLEASELEIGINPKIKKIKTKKIKFILREDQHKENQEQDLKEKDKY